MAHQKKQSKGYLKALELINENIKMPKPLLDLRNLELTALPEELFQLVNLKRLLLSDNNLTEIPPEIAKLSNLNTLDLSNNHLASLPSEIVDLINIKIFDLRGNPLPIPQEILSRWKESSIILQYIRENFVQIREEDTRPLKEVKVLLVGQGRVGKTSLVKYLVHNEKCDPTEPLTHGIKRENWHLNVTDSQTQREHDVQLNIWDFGGQDIMHSTHEFFLTSRSLYLLVLDAGRDEAGNKLDYWLRKIKSFASGAPIIVVINKSESNTLPLAYKDLQKNYNIKNFFDVSCENGKEIPALREAIKNEIGIMPEVFQPVRKEWFTVKSILENIKKDYISIEKYREICEENEITERLNQDLLLYLLHELGIVLHFSDYKTKVLNPEWVRRGVYKVVTSLDVMQNKGVLTPKLLASELDALNDEFRLENKDYLRYPPEEYKFITDLMQQFELCYPIADSKGFFVPSLLPKDTPFVGDWDETECLGFRFNYENGLLHESIMSSFIVKMHPYILDNTQWLTGVLLKNQHGNRSLVKADLSNGVINILIDGNKHTRREFLAIIRDQFRKIHDKLKSNKPSEEVPLKDFPQKYISYELLLQLERDGKTTNFDSVGGKLVEYNVKEMLEGVSTRSEREKDLKIQNKQLQNSNSPQTQNESKLETAQENLPQVTSSQTSTEVFKKESFTKVVFVLLLIILILVGGFLLVDYLINGKITGSGIIISIIASILLIIIIASFGKTESLSGDNLVAIVGKVLDRIGILQQSPKEMLPEKSPEHQSTETLQK